MTLLIQILMGMKFCFPFFVSILSFLLEKYWKWLNAVSLQTFSKDGANWLKNDSEGFLSMISKLKKLK